MPRRHNLPITALASFPRSGNTWLRYMIEQATGLKSGSEYNDKVLPRQREGIVVKTHSVDWSRFDKGIHLVRNPYDAIASYWFWKKDIAGEDIEWERHVAMEARIWMIHTRLWSTAKIPTIRIKYEELHLNPEWELNRVLEWLEVEGDIEKAIEDGRIENMRKLTKLNFFRQGKVGKGIKKFTEPQRLHVLDTCKEGMDKFGYA